MLLRSTAAAVLWWVHPHVCISGQLWKAAAAAAVAAAVAACVKLRKAVSANGTRQGALDQRTECCNTPLPLPLCHELLANEPAEAQHATEQRCEW
jgi:hypothetical protein